MFHCTYVSHLLYSSVDGHLGCFHVLALVNSAAMNIGVYVSFWIMVFSGYMPRSRIAWSYGSSIKTKINKWELIKRFCTANKTIKKMKRQPSGWEKIFAKEAMDKWLISRLYKQLMQLSITETPNNPIKKWEEELNRHTDGQLTCEKMFNIANY